MALVVWKALIAEDYDPYRLGRLSVYSGTTPQNGRCQGSRALSHVSWFRGQSSTLHLLFTLKLPVSVNNILSFEQKEKGYCCS